MKHLLTALLLTALPLYAADGEKKILFDGENLDSWDFAEGGWEIADDGSLTCNMEETTTKSGEKKLKGMGNIWTQEEYEDFELTLSYKLSEGANSGVFYRAVKEDSVHQGFEVQLMDNEGFQKTHGEKEPRKLNGTFYDAAPPLADPRNPVGEWDTLKLKAVGPNITCWINGTKTFDVDVNDWPEIGKNPDGTTNKFKTAIKDKPGKGYVGLQNHGQKVWFKDIAIRRLD